MLRHVRRIILFFSYKAESEAQWQHGREELQKSPSVIIFKTGEYVYFLLQLIKSHSKVKCNIQQSRCGTDNDTGEKRVDENYTNK